jgi:hypothetical protein
MLQLLAVFVVVSLLEIGVKKLGCGDLMESYPAELQI